MTSNISLFNFGIFKNTIYRFKWGSFLYFIALFFSVPFILMVEDLEHLVSRYNSGINDVSVLLRGDLMGIPAALAVLVPTIVAALIFNNVHSGKQSIFVHSLPVDRRENYISSLMAAFVLMGAPVLMVAGILLVMSFTAYGQVMSSWSVVYWAGLNLSILFIMFSVATFSAFLTGNTAAHIGINVFIHLIPMLVALTVILISEKFLFGFIQSNSFIANEIMENTPVIWLFGRAVSHYNNELNVFTYPQLWIYLIGAVLVYTMGYILYKNRKIENCGDVAAFGVFKPILKYAVVTAAAVAIFGIITSTGMGAIAVFTVAIVITAIVYFAAEMLMNKSFKVFKKSYKGYIGFVACCTVFISFFAYTNVFGYETRIPQSDKVEAAAVFTGWGAPPVIANLQLIEDTKTLHKEIISDIPVVEDEDMGYKCSLYISYKLKDGNVLARRYNVSEEMYDKAISEMYKHKDYKLKVTEIDNLNIENIPNITLGAYASGYNYYIPMNEDAKALMLAVKKDVEMLSFKEIEDSQYAVDIRLEFDCTVKENQYLKVFKTTGYDANDAEAEYAIESFNITINPNFKNTYAFLREKGYYDQIIKQIATNTVVLSKPIYRAGELYTYKGQTGQYGEFMVSRSDCVNIAFEDAKKLAEMMVNIRCTDMSEGKNYFVFTHSRDVSHHMSFGEKTISFGETELPDYMKKYVEE
ncbi:MAG: hypothetical protein IKW62_06595 [Clostridia bacterium]|nr:hypothetical protein [Clostridia bacterium]